MPVQTENWLQCQKLNSYKFRRAFCTPISVKKGQPSPNQGLSTGRQGRCHVHSTLYQSVPIFPYSNLSASAEPLQSTLYQLTSSLAPSPFPLPPRRDLVLSMHEISQVFRGFEQIPRIRYICEPCSYVSPKWAKNWLFLWEIAVL